MSKELECLDRIDKRNYLTEREHKEFLGVVESALTEYEAIKNAEPGKALECLERIDKEYGTIECDDFDNCFNTIKQALQRLESIDNSNPSEALELVKRTCELYVDSLKLRDLIGYDIIEKQINEALDIIKQTLLKTQEPKQYLKWEDLDFKEKGQWLEVKMGDNLYTMSYSLYKNGVIRLEYRQRICLELFADRKQFFNDLHLERVK